MPRDWVGTLFLGAFGSVFAIAGLAVLLFLAPEKLRGGSLEDKIGILVVGVLFALVGAGLIAVTLRAHAEGQRNGALRERYPDAPWMWRREWASGQIRGSASLIMIFTWCFAAFWNAIAWPVLPQILRQADQKPLAWIGLLFPIVGVGLIVWAATATLRAKRFGTGTLSLETLPGVIGGRFVGSVESGRPLPAGVHVRVRLACFRRVTTGSGKSRSTHESILWENETQIGPELIAMGPRGSQIPVAFTIPSSCRPTDDERVNNSVHWRLELSANLPGIDYQSYFEVPVFRTSESRDDVVDGPPQVVDRSERALQLASAKIRSTPLPDGGVELYLPPARNPGLATVLAYYTVTAKKKRRRVDSLWQWPSGKSRRATPRRHPGEGRLLVERARSSQNKKRRRQLSPAAPFQEGPTLELLSHQRNWQYHRRSGA